MAKASDLLSITSRVEVPFIIASLGGMELGQFQESKITDKDRYNHQYCKHEYSSLTNNYFIILYA